MALFIWLFYVLFYDLLVIGATFLPKEGAANNFIFASLLGNPVDMVRVASLLVLGGKEVFRAAGAALLRSLGGETASIALLVAIPAVWIVVPFFFSQRVLEQQDI